MEKKEKPIIEPLEDEDLKGAVGGWKFRSVIPPCPLCKATSESGLLEPTQDGSGVRCTKCNIEYRI